MATYAELADIQQQAGFNDFLNKIRVAATIKAQSIVDSPTPTAAEIAWAQSTLNDPASAGDGVMWYAIASNSGAAVSAILTASDAAIQTAVNDAVSAIVAGGV